MRRHRRFDRLVTRLAAWSGLCAVVIVSGCAGTATAPAPQADAHALTLMKRVQAQPTGVFGGGMVYELFVGQRFTARFDQKDRSLALITPDNQRTCRYDKAGFLQLSDNDAKDTAQFCADFVAGASEFAAPREDAP